MGADGHIVIAKLKDFKGANPEVDPGDLGLYSGQFLGMDCCWGYYGDNTDGSYHITPYDFEDDYSWNQVPEAGKKNYRTGWIYTEKEVENIKAAAEWFENNAESHEVWT